MQPTRSARRPSLKSVTRQFDKVVVAVLMAVLLAVSVGGAFAVADESGGPIPAPLTTDSGPLESAAEPVTDPAAASTFEMEGIGREEAEEVIEGVFGDALEGPAQFLDELEIDAFRSDYVAVVAPPSPASSPGLISSVLPLRTENQSGEKELVDLGLENSGDYLVPDNPLVDLRIPTDLGDGIVMPDSGVRIEMPSSAERSASTLGDASAFFPNVETDTDFVATAAPTGVETYTHLRSAESPTTQEFRLALPAGARLVSRPDGGAQVLTQEGDVLMVIRPPSAIDAGGNQVPVDLQIAGESLILSVSPGVEASFPILVDPYFESYTWGNGQGTSAGWKQYSGTGFSSSWTMAGANVWSNEGSTTPGNQASIKYYVPRYWQDLEDKTRAKAPTTFIRNMKLWNFFFTIPFNNPFRNHPYAWMGLYDNDSKTWISSYTRTASEGALNNPSWIYEMKNLADNDDVKEGGFGLATSESSNGYRRDAYAGNATVEVTDDDSPGFAEMDDQVQGWVNTGKKFAPYYKAGDDGLGVYQLRMKYPAAAGGPGEATTGMGCTGSAASPCPYSTFKSFDWDPALMAQGELDVRAYAVDPIGHWSPAAEVRIRIDHSKPDLGLSGTLTEQATVGTNLSGYTLNYAAKDGDDAAAAALTPAGSAGKGEGQLERPMSVAIAPDGSVYTVDRLNNRVVKYDKEGKFALQFGSTGSGDTLLNDPRGIDIAPDGTVWVADMGNDSVKAFSPSGTFLRKARFTDSASEPYAVASGPGGVLWVTDIGLHRVIKLSENPVTTLLTTTGKSGCPGKCVGTALISPTGIATDKFGNVWVADGGLGKVLELDSSGIWKFEFGTAGSGDGQINGIVGIDVSPAGNIAITERNNGRVQIFRPDGSYLRKFGTAGGGNNQFFEAGGLSFGPDNSLAVADAGNKRVARWSHADLDRQSGASKVEVKVDGASVHTKAPGCSSGDPYIPGKNCSISGSWTLDADDYAGGAHNVEVIATDVVGISSTKTVNIETHGDHTDPAIALSGTMTQQASNGTTRPTYKLKAVSSDSGPAEERKSGVASTVIKVDGVVVDSSSPGCPAGGCSITREWTLNSNSYPVGSHTVEVKATDAVGRSTTKTLTINIARDETAPEFTSLANFYTAPSGWLEQKGYLPSVIITDSNGYGVASVQLKIDSQVVQSAVANPCPDGGCARFFGYSQTVDMTGYSGGAHPAELVATDGAGNTRKRTWTINVVPNGQIPPAEADDTLEALEAVTEEVLVAPQSPEEPFYPGPESESELKEDSSGFHTVGAAAETTLGEQPEDGFEIETADGVVEVTPVGVDPAASPIESSSDISAISSNTGKAVDTIYRPIYDGAMTFQSIRTPTGTDEFSWTVNLRPGQYLEKVEDRTVQVISSVFERPVFTITAIEAHDAVGSTVPTTLSASGSTITLKVHHKAGNPAAGNAPFVYPVIAGSGWEGGIVVHQVVGPPPTESVNPETFAFYETEIGPPELVPASEADGEASASSVSPERRRQFVRSVCGHSMEWVESQEGGEAIAEHKLERLCGNAFDPVNHPGVAVVWRGSQRGAFFYTPAAKVRHRGAIDCARHIGPAASKMKFYAIKDAYECHWGPKTSDDNGGVHASAGHYLRAQAHWELGQRGKCYGNQPSEECTPPDTCWEWMDRAVELHIWPSGNIDPIRLLVEPPPGNC